MLVDAFGGVDFDADGDFDTLELGETQSVTFTYGIGEAGQFGSATVTVNVSQGGPNERPVLNLEPEDPVLEEGGDAFIFVLSRTGPVDLAMDVELESSDLTEVTVPDFVSFLAGENETTFTVTPVDDTEIEGVQFAILTASALGFDSVDSVVTVLDNDVL